MLVVPHHSASPLPTDADPLRPARTRAVAFLHDQARVLHDALAAPGNGLVLARTLKAHDEAHGQWCATIAAANVRFSADAARSVAGLYGFHGRVAGSLELGATNLLPLDVAAAVREMLAERLDQLTGEAVSALGA